MKTFIAVLGTETNTFSPMPTGWQTFEDTLLCYGDATQRPPNWFTQPLFAWRKATEQRQGQVVESVAAFAQPAGITARPVYEALRDRLLADLKAALPVDMVLLSMHGAMVADGYDDCEGDVLVRVRELVGSATSIGVELDLHCSITREMLDNADVIVTFKEYPHIDSVERAQEVFDLCVAQQRGEIKPAMAVYDTRMINMWRTPMEPVKSFVEKMQSLEGQDGILSVSFAHGFPWGDVPEASGKMLVISDNDTEKAAALAKELGRELWNMREQAALTGLSIDAALDAALASERQPVVLADIADNAGGGAPSDATFLLRAVLERNITNVVSGLYWDPIAVRMCQEGGEGATLDLRIGGKCGPMSGDPVDLRVRIVRIADDLQQTFGSSLKHIGTAVWVRNDERDLDLVLNTLRTQTFHPDAFTQLGIDLNTKHIVIIKSTQHFYAGFEPVAALIIYVATPGAITPDFAGIPFRKFTRPYWPRVADPFTD
jgi:microcystin degradation protein MlrC